MSALRILVVEDDERLAEVFRDFTAELGYLPIVVGSAEAALEALTSARPDAILLDVRLPGMSGVEFLNLAEVRDSGVPVVVVSGVATEMEARACLKLGALDFIRKPVTLERLGQVLAYLGPFALSRPQ
ncbi:MAG: response regulator, partial [Candidatus Rokuibacteriota bacterium]